MDKQLIFKLLTLSGLHMNIRLTMSEVQLSEEHKSILEEKIRGIGKILEINQTFLGVLDKPRLLKEALSEYMSLMAEGVSDVKICDHIGTCIKDANQDIHKLFYDGLIWIALKNDNTISSDEKEILFHFYESCKISDQPFENYLKSTIKNLDAKEIKSTENKNESINWKFFLAIGTLTVAIIIFSGVYVFTKPSSSGLANRSLANLSYKKISFERYLAAGNFNSGARSDLTGKIVVFYIRGTADVEFDLRKLTLSSDKKELIYNNPEANKTGIFREVLPYNIKVNIEQQDYREVLNIGPQPINQKQAEKIGQVVGVVAAVGGAYVGGKIGTTVGATVGSFMPNKIYALSSGAIGGLAGGLLGGAAAGAGGYIATKNFLTGLNITSEISQADKEEILFKAKQLIASELFFNDKLEEELKAAFEKYVKNLYSQYGYEIAAIKYSNTTTQAKEGV